MFANTLYISKKCCWYETSCFNLSSKFEVSIIVSGEQKNISHLPCLPSVKTEPQQDCTLLFPEGGDNTNDKKGYQDCPENHVKRFLFILGH